MGSGILEFGVTAAIFCRNGASALIQKLDGKGVRSEEPKRKACKEVYDFFGEVRKLNYNHGQLLRE